MENPQNLWLRIIKGLASITLNLGQTQFSVLTIIQAVLCFTLIFILTRYFNSLLKTILFHRLIVEKGIRDIFANLISYGTGAFVFIIILQSIGFNLSSLAVIGGALGIGIGLGLQDLTKNLASGLTLLAEQKIKLGDFIRFGEYEGHVQEISPRAVIIRRRDGASVIMPNSVLIENQVTNYYYETEAIRLSLFVGVAYHSDPVIVTETLLFAAYSQCHILKEPAPQALFKDFGDHALNFELWVWIRRENMGIYPNILSSLRFTVEYYFRRNQIVIPFPQQDLWIRNPEAIAASLNAVNSLPEMPVDLTNIESVTTSETESLVPLRPTPISLSKVLKSVLYFKDFDDLEIRQLLEIGRRKTLYPGEVLFREDDLGDAFYIILSGRVEVFAEKLNKVLATLDSGNFFGELSLMLGTPRTATIRATEDTVLFGINHKGFESLLQSNPDFRDVIIQELSKHQEELAQRKQELEKRGLVPREENDANLVNWVKKRFARIFEL